MQEFNRSNGASSKKSITEWQTARPERINLLQSLNFKVKLGRRKRIINLDDLVAGYKLLGQESRKA